MDRLKKFLNEKKVNKNFKKAGAGYRLTGDNSSIAAPRPVHVQQQTSQMPPAERIATADIAAQAAYKRMNLGATQESLTQRNIRIRALKELEKEKREREKCASDKLDVEVENHIIDTREFEHSGAVSGVYFTCDLLGGDEQLTKNEMREKVERFLRTQLADDPLVASTLMIFSLNGPDKRENASEIIQKYLTNLIENPDENKYRRIRMNNKIFQERVSCANGGKEFLLACGFEEKNLINNEQQEPFLVIPDDKALDTQSLIQALEILQTGQAVPLKLSRNAAVYKLEANQVITNPKLSRDVFDLDVAEIKREQQRREADVEKFTTLRTREMREKDELMRSYRYNYTLIRIRFPNRFLLQGTFGCCEPFYAVRSFVEQHLAQIEPMLFVLKDPISGKVISNDTMSLNELNLLPAAVLHFEWDSDVQNELMRLGREVLYLDHRFIETAEPFTAA
uniref:UBX domain-containing protein n=1 Tax=Onchocerca volvulus TaxID=6282 RepID=A0A8R1XWX7_ONCVO